MLRAFLFEDYVREIPYSAEYHYHVDLASVTVLQAVPNNC